MEKRCFEATRNCADRIGRESAHVWRHAKFQRGFRPRSIASALSTSRGYGSDSLRRVASVHSSSKEKMRQVANLSVLAGNVVLNLFGTPLAQHDGIISMVPGYTARH